MAAERPSFEALVRAYLRAKDENRPHLIDDAFAPDARLEVRVRAGAIAFPPVAVGSAAIADVLVRRFAQVYENVYTFCLARPADGDATDFACPWLVAMSAKADGTLRVGCGSYAWRRQSGAPWLVERLVIEIDAMRELPAEASRAVFDWVRHLPYPWCPPAAAACVPEGVGLEVVARALDRQPARH